MNQTARIELPIPTSTNALYERSRNGVRISAAYTKWQLLANLAIAAQGPHEPFTRPVEIMLTVHGGKGFDPNVRDMDNLLKAALDKLRDRRILPGDTARMIPRGRWEFIEATDANQKARCIVEIRAAE